MNRCGAPALLSARPGLNSGVATFRETVAAVSACPFPTMKATGAGFSRLYQARGGRPPWIAIVPDYRAYIVGPDGHFIGMHEISAADRSEATSAALKLVDGHPVSLWEGEEWIGTLKPGNPGCAPIFKRPPRRR